MFHNLIYLILFSGKGALPVLSKLNMWLKGETLVGEAHPKGLSGQLFSISGKTWGVSLLKFKWAISVMLLWVFLLLSINCFYSLQNIDLKNLRIGGDL